MIQRMFVTLDTKKTNYKNVGKINHGDDLILELTVLSDGNMISFNDPMVDLLVKKSDGKMIRQNSGIEHIKPNKFIIEVSKDCVTSPGLSTNQLIINDNGRISTCMFYYTILNSLEEDIIESISNVEVLEQLDEFTIQMKDKMENFDEELQNRMSELEDAIDDLVEFFGDTSVDLVEAELSRNEAEQSRAQAESVRVQNENRRLQNDLDLANAEAERVRAENIRIQNEADRALVDAVMDQKESQREDSELERIQNESKRATDELVRQQNESTRQSNESVRISNENDRKTQENRRATAETNRVNAETTRRSNENSRISNEIERQKAMDEMKSLMEDAREFDERVGVVEDEIEEINSSLDDIKNKVQEWANVKSFGADDKGESDCSEIIQTCLENYDVVYIPSGTYRIDKTIILPFNKVLIGDISRKTVLIGTMSKEYMIQYGEDYNYNGYRGRIENIRFTSKNKIDEKPYGVYANSGVLIKNCDFYSIGKVFDRNYNYIDMIKLEGVYCGYCVPNGDYLIKISGNNDALEINQLKIAMFDGDSTEFNGIYINRCHGGAITNSIPNCFITIENVNGFSIDNSHIEGDENYLIIKDSHVTFNNCFKFKNESVYDFNILSTNYDKTTSVIFNNFNFYLPAERVNRFKKYVEEIAPLTNNTIVKMNNCFRVENMADKNRTTLNTNGVLIKDLEEFNINSNAFSTSCTIRNLNVDSVIPKIGVNYNVSLGSGNVTNLIGWQGVERDTVLYRAINVVDETRKIITSYSKYITVNNVTDNGVSIVLSANMVSNNGLLYLYRGSDNSSYNEVCKIPIVSRCILMDNGISVNGFSWESTPTTTIINDYNKVTSYEKNGDNVIIETSSTPILGTWKKGDKVINTNITSGQPIGWVYDGTTWVSYGQYI